MVDKQPGYKQKLVLCVIWCRENGGVQKWKKHLDKDYQELEKKKA